MPSRLLASEMLHHPPAHPQPLRVTWSRAAGNTCICTRARRHGERSCGAAAGYVAGMRPSAVVVVSGLCCHSAASNNHNPPPPSAVAPSARRRTVRKTSCCACTTANCFCLNLFTLGCFTPCCFCPRVLGATFKGEWHVLLLCCFCVCAVRVGAEAPTSRESGVDGWRPWAVGWRAGGWLDMCCEGGWGSEPTQTPTPPPHHHPTTAQAPAPCPLRWRSFWAWWQPSHSTLFFGRSFHPRCKTAWTRGRIADQHGQLQLMRFDGLQRSLHLGLGTGCPQCWSARLRRERSSRAACRPPTARACAWLRALPGACAAAAACGSAGSHGQPAAGAVRWQAELSEGPSGCLPASLSPCLPIFLPALIDTRNASRLCPPPTVQMLATSPHRHQSTLFPNRLLTVCAHLYFVKDLVFFKCSCMMEEREEEGL